MTLMTTFTMMIHTVWISPRPGVAFKALRRTMAPDWSCPVSMPGAT